MTEVTSDSISIGALAAALSTMGVVVRQLVKGRNGNNIVEMATDIAVLKEASNNTKETVRNIERKIDAIVSAMGVRVVHHDDTDPG